MKLEYSDDKSGFFDENPHILKKLIFLIIAFLLGCVTAFIITIPLSALNLVSGEGIEILIAIGGFFGIILAAFNHLMLKVQAQNSEIIKQNEELKALILDIKNKDED